MTSEKTSNAQTERADVVIVGAGQAGAHVAMFLRQQKYAGSVMLIGEEPVLPYERPAMSKEYLSGEKTFDKLVLRPETFWAERKIDVRCGERVDAVDVARREVRTRSGKVIGWTKLVWAAGGRPRKITVSGHDLAGVHYVRDRADVDRMKSELDAGIERVVIIGGGYIGLEVAAALNKQGKKVTVLEAQDRVLARVAAEPLSRFFEEEHRARGVEIRLSAMVTSLEGSKDGKVAGVKLASGEQIEASLVVVGIGIDAAVEALREAGAAGDNGVNVDLRCRTSVSDDVYAIGDCANHENVHANGKRVRLESIQNANDQAMVVAKDIAGTLKSTERYESVPWFWSNQFDIRLQTVGLFTDHDEVLLRGDPKSKSFSVVYLRAGKVIALDCVNQTKDYMQGKSLITSKATQVDRAKLQSPEFPLKDL